MVVGSLIVVGVAGITTIAGAVIGAHIGSAFRTIGGAERGADKRAIHVTLRPTPTWSHCNSGAADRCADDDEPDTSTVEFADAVAECASDGCTFAVPNVRSHTRSIVGSDDGPDDAAHSHAVISAIGTADSATIRHAGSSADGIAFGAATTGADSDSGAADSIANDAHAVCCAHGHSESDADAAAICHASRRAFGYSDGHADADAICGAVCAAATWSHGHTGATDRRADDGRSDVGTIKRAKPAA